MAYDFLYLLGVHFGSCLAAEKSRENEKLSGNFDGLGFEKAVVKFHFFVFSFSQQPKVCNGSVASFLLLLCWSFNSFLISYCRLKLYKLCLSIATWIICAYSYTRRVVISLGTLGYVYSLFIVELLNFSWSKLEWVLKVFFSLSVFEGPHYFLLSSIYCLLAVSIFLQVWIFTWQILFALLARSLYPSRASNQTDMCCLLTVLRNMDPLF